MEDLLVLADGAVLLSPHDATQSCRQTYVHIPVFHFCFWAEKQATSVKLKGSEKCFDLYGGRAE